MLNDLEVPKSAFELATVTLYDDFVRLWPKEWQDKPKATQAVYAIRHADGTDEYFPTHYFGRRCAGAVPTEDEIVALRDEMVAHGEIPVAYLMQLCYVVVPDWPEGEDPTMGEFFIGDYDKTNMKQVAMLVSYPCMKG